MFFDVSDPVESLAKNLFSRDHPERDWPLGGQPSFGASVASPEEINLYKDFARGNLDSRAITPSPAAFDRLSETAF